MEPHKDMKCIPWSLEPLFFFSFLFSCLYVCVCVWAGHKTPVIASMVDRVPQRDFTPFPFIAEAHWGGPTSLGRFPFPIRTGRERSFPFFSFLLLVYLIVYCRSFNESLFKLYRSHSFLTLTSNPAARRRPYACDEYGITENLFRLPILLCVHFWFLKFFLWSFILEERTACRPWHQGMPFLLCVHWHADESF